VIAVTRIVSPSTTRTTSAYAPKASGSGDPCPILGAP